MSSKELGAVFDPEIHGPGQMRFGFNGTHSLEADPDPVSELNRRLHKSGMFPNSEPDDLPPPEIEFSNQFLKIIKTLNELGSIKYNGEYIDRSDDEDPEIKETALELLKRIQALFPPRTEDAPPETGTQTFFRETPLVKKMLSKVEPPKVQHYTVLQRT